MCCSMFIDSVDDRRCAADDPGQNQEDSRHQTVSRTQKSEWIWVVARVFWVIVRHYKNLHILFYWKFFHLFNFFLILCPIHMILGTYHLETPMTIMYLKNFPTIKALRRYMQNNWQIKVSLYKCVTPDQCPNDVQCPSLMKLDAQTTRHSEDICKVASNYVHGGTTYISVGDI